MVQDGASAGHGAVLAYAGAILPGRDAVDAGAKLVTHLFDVFFYTPDSPPSLIGEARLPFYAATGGTTRLANTRAAIALRGIPVHLVAGRGGGGRQGQNGERRGGQLHGGRPHQ